MFNLLGGPSHIDMFDLKPEAPGGNPRRVPADRHVRARPRDLRAPAAAGAVDAPGDSDPHVHPHLQLARSAAVHDRLHRQRPARPGAADRPARHRRDLPVSGAGPRGPAGRGLHAVLSRLGRRAGGGGALRRIPRQAVRSAVHAVQADDSSASRSVKYYDPVLPIGEPFLPGAESLDELPAIRLDSRRSLLDQLDTTRRRGWRHRPAWRRWTTRCGRAFAMLTSSRTREAFDLSREPAKVREAYGRNLTGSSLLMPGGWSRPGCRSSACIRRSSTTTATPTTCTRTTSACSRTTTCRLLDQVVPALLEDLDGRGLLDFDAGGRDGRDGPLAAGQRQGRPRPLAAVRLQPADRRRHPAGHGLRRDATGSPPIRQPSGVARRPRGDDLPPAGHRPAP